LPGFAWKAKCLITGRIACFAWFACLPDCLDCLGRTPSGGLRLPGKPSVGPV